MADTYSSSLVCNDDDDDDVQRTTTQIQIERKERNGDDVRGYKHNMNEIHCVADADIDILSCNIL